MLTNVDLILYYILAASNNAGQIQSRTTTPNYINYGVTEFTDFNTSSINNQHSAYNGPNHHHSSLFNPPNGSLSLSSLHEFGRKFVISLEILGLKNWFSKFFLIFIHFTYQVQCHRIRCHFQVIKLQIQPPCILGQAVA